MAMVNINGSPTVNYAKVNLASDFDLTLRVIEPDDTVFGDNKPIRLITDFEVKRELVSQQRFSGMLYTMLKPNGSYREAKSNTVELKHEDCRAFEPFLREVHGDHNHEVGGIDLKTVWHVLYTADYLKSSIEPLKTWFHRWYQAEKRSMVMLDEEKRIESARQILFPAYAFHHAEAFMTATKYLVYNGNGHLTETTPLEQTRLHLPSIVIRMSNPALFQLLVTAFRSLADIVPEQLNAAKGRVRTILHNGLFGACEPLLGKKCGCKEKAFFGYFKEMCDRHILPFETTFKGCSVEDMLARAGRFNWTPPPDVGLCCRTRYKALVQASILKASAYFDGLCLDCMVVNTQDRHGDYWNHSNSSGWDKGCRTKHKEPTWYFSFMGRKEFQIAMMRERNERSWNAWDD